LPSIYVLSDARSLVLILENISETTGVTPISFSFLLSPDADIPTIIAVRSKPVLCICNGYSDKVSSSIALIYPLTPLDIERISAIPIIPIEPANDVRRVLAFLVLRF